MRIAVVELDVRNHYPAVNSIAKIYASRPENRVAVFTTEVIAQLLRALPPASNVDIRVPQSASLTSILQMVRREGFDRLHLCSLYADFESVLATEVGCPVYLGIHNSEAWEPRRFPDRLRRAARRVALGWNRDLLYQLRNSFPREVRDDVARSRVLRSVLRNGKAVAYGPHVARTLSTWLPATSIVTVPFCVFEGGEPAARGAQRTRLRVGIPGGVSEQRRDYMSLLDALERAAHLRDRLMIDLVGTAKEGSRVLGRVREFEASGFSIRYSTSPLSEESFSERLWSSDLILGNLRVDEAGYGRTTESGVVFAMVRHAKPGLLPQGLPQLPELVSSTIRYTDADDACAKLTALTEDRGHLSELCAAARRNSEAFTPDRFLESLS